MKLKVVTDLRSSRRIVIRPRFGPDKAAAWRRYRRRVHQTDMLADDPNFEPRKSERFTDWNAC